jgi:hypothetical protein
MFSEAICVHNYDTCLYFCYELIRRYRKRFRNYVGPGIADCVLADSTLVALYKFRVSTKDAKLLEEGIQQIYQVLARRDIRLVAARRRPPLKRLPKQPRKKRDSSSEEE